MQLQLSIFTSNFVRIFS
uniref:Uncharacterized protein n=1 Tax=Arundo donax TaxID=35708 RepID=A0A0A9ABQ2_ARUDO